jgi:hypothetical protein
MRGERGSVTAEFVAALPAVVLLLALALGALALGSQSVRLQDAAGLTARALARGDPPEAADAIAGALVPGVAVARSERSGLVCVLLMTRGSGPLSGLQLRAESCALAER